MIEDAEQNLTPRLRWLLDRMWQEWKQVELDIGAMSDELERVSEEHELCRRLRKIPGFGGKPGGDNVSFVIARFIRTDTRASSSSARRSILH